MKLAVENKKDKIGFYRIDGRHLTKFIDKVKRDIPDYREVWTYEKIDNGVFINVKSIIKN